MAALALSARACRDQLPTASDWTQLKDSVLDDEAMVQWQSYRQALRDVPQQAGFPDAVKWPAVPDDGGE
ncbi:tail fiber assembly protein [Pseudodesulfovibrio sp.]|uniref:tail fiber assembly protein n=1 Tax=unclassified Pseudodesulfovibrio TaxID=2661612 RepID=UPI003AFF735E